MALKFAFLPFKGTFEFVMSTEPVTPVVVDGCNLLLQTGDALLLQNGDNLTLQGCPEAQDYFLLLQTGDYLLQQSGDKLVV